MVYSQQVMHPAFLNKEATPANNVSGFWETWYNLLFKGSNLPKPDSLGFDHWYVINTIFIIYLAGLFKSKLFIKSLRI